MASAPKLAKYELEIRNHVALEKLASKLTPVLVTPETPQAPKQDSDFFSRLNIAAKIETNYGEYFSVDAQPDLRFPLYFSVYNITRTFPTIDYKAHPYVSPFTLVAYDQMLIAAHLLLNDIHHRPQTSFQANKYRRDNSASDFLKLLMDAYVPSYLEPLIAQLTAVYDPNRPGLIFVPDLAATSWLHDFGRLIPAYIMISAHSILATIRTAATPEEILREFYDTLVVTVQGQAYYVSNFLGTQYAIGGAFYTHPNWLNQVIEEIFNPVVGRALTNRPTLARIRMTPLIFPQNNAVNAYDALFGYSDANLQALLATVENVSDFIKTSKTGNRTLISISGEAAGITILSHSVEPPTLPTWHRLTPTAQAPAVRTDEQYAHDIHFMEPKVLGAADLNVPTLAQCLPILALVNAEDCTEDNEPFPADTFNPTRDVYPPVLYFQPYDRSPSTLNYTVTLGLKIESAELDAVVIPTPNERDSLIDNNSRFRQGSIPISQLYPCYFTEVAPLIISTRFLHSSMNDPLGLAIVDMTRNALPYFGNAHVVAPVGAVPEFVAVQPVHRPADAFTYTATSGNNDYPTVGRKFYLWSSYRYVEVPTAHVPVVHQFFTLRAMFGTSVCLSRTENPARILPH